MATVIDIIDDALQEIGAYGAGETVSGSDSAVALRALNNLLDDLRNQDLSVYAQQNVSATLPANTQSLTIGPTLEIDVARPVKIESGSFVTQSNLDYPLRVITRKEYNDIVLKNVEGSWPSVCFYDALLPTGNVFFFPKGACTVTLVVQIPFAQYATTGTTLVLPPGVERMLGLMLAVEVASKFRLNVTDSTVNKCDSAVRNYKRLNLKVPQLESLKNYDGRLVRFLQG